MMRTKVVHSQTVRITPNIHLDPNRVVLESVGLLYSQNNLSKLLALLEPHMCFLRVS